MLTAIDASQANQRIEDADVLAFATQAGRALVTYNRRHFIRLHAACSVQHGGIVACTVDVDIGALAERIDREVTRLPALEGCLVRITRRSSAR